MCVCTWCVLSTSLVAGGSGGARSLCWNALGPWGITEFDVLMRGVPLWSTRSPGLVLLVCVYVSVSRVVRWSLTLAAPLQHRLGSCWSGSAPRLVCVLSVEICVCAGGCWCVCPLRLPPKIVCCVCVSVCVLWFLTVGVQLRPRGARRTLYLDRIFRLMLSGVCLGNRYVESAVCLCAPADERTAPRRRGKSGTRLGFSHRVPEPFS